MALARPLFVGFSSASRLAREGGDLEVSVLVGRTRGGPRRTFLLPWFFVRDVDALLERWRREEHEDELLTLHRGNLGMTLCRAAGEGGLRDTTFLLASGADLNQGMPYWPPLVCAATCGRLAVVTLLLDAGAEQLDYALLHAAGNNHLAVAALLLDRGADASSRGHAALQTCANNGYLEMVRLLLDRGAEAGGGGDGQPLRLARMEGHEAIVALLLERGA